ncbi:hypothetical protein [Alicyclobacillus acidiphilus]|uniref:hypothetical protein n=1 Tax=Alicyclobacillus acidiphilus TaxID=182455 RepID=UPI000830A2B6|nr:hypothetical protein [Alicyclobacillus acidiphilus]
MSENRGRVYIGQEFIEDKETVDVAIRCTYYYSAHLSPLELSWECSTISVRQDGNLLTVLIKRPISKKLYESAIAHRGNATMFIIGYIEAILPVVNREIISQKYLSGHILHSLLSTIGIDELALIRMEDGIPHRLPWPVAVLPFPSAEALAKEYDNFFIRDFIDAMTCYFSFSLDECIRKIITSIENFFTLRRIYADKFKKKLNLCLQERYYPVNWGPYLSILKRNIEFIYGVRNNIVHNTFRMDYQHRFICKKGIGTLSYIYQSSLNEPEVVRYTRALTQQFLLFETQYSGINLDILKSHLEGTDTSPIVDNTRDLDAFMFKGLEITADERNIIRRQAN